MGGKPPILTAFGLSSLTGILVRVASSKTPRKPPLAIPPSLPMRRMPSIPETAELSRKMAVARVGFPPLVPI